MSNHILIYPDEKSGGREQSYFVAILWDEQIQDVGDVVEWCHNYDAACEAAEEWALKLGLEIREDEE